jgi:hypothetical protein
MANKPNLHIIIVGDQKNHMSKDYVGHKYKT